MGPGNGDGPAMGSGGTSLEGFVVVFFWGWEDFDMQFAGYILLVRPLLIPHSPVFVIEKPY